MNNLDGYAMYQLFLTSRFKCIDSKHFDSNKFSSNNSKGYVLEVDLEYPKELCELHNYHLLAPNEIEIKKEMSSYQLKIADFCNISIGNVENCCQTLLIKKSMCSIMRTHNLT